MPVADELRSNSVTCGRTASQTGYMQFVGAMENIIDDSTNSIINTVKKVKLSLCLTNSAVPHEHIRGIGCRDPRILDLGASWR
jgi:hypothetical protein